MDLDKEEMRFWSSKISHKDIYCKIMTNSGTNFDEKCNNFKESVPRSLLGKFIRLKSKLNERRKCCNYMDNRFVEKHRQWLELVWHEGGTEVKPGRPNADFASSSGRTKRRRVKKIVEEVDSQELLLAARSKIYRKGKRQAASVMDGLMGSPSKVKKIKMVIEEDRHSSLVKNTLTAKEALGMIVDADLTRNQYNIVRGTGTNKKLYPSYSIVQREKRKCYPAPEAVTITETKAEVDLKELLKLTTHRLLIALPEMPEERELTLISKWGCDGSQQAEYKQVFKDEVNASDSAVFQSSMVPLKLVSTQTGLPIWVNPLPSSPRLCRPIRIHFKKETAEGTQEEMQHIEDSLTGFNNVTLNVFDKTYKIKVIMLPTMVDGKVCNAATDTRSTMACYICGGNMNTFNDLTISRKVNEESLKFGLSTLHARIRLMESILKISYKLPLKKWKVPKKDVEGKRIMKERKKEIQRRFKTELGLIVDVPKAGAGNTNDGNTSRRFFESPEKAHDITGFDLSLIQRLKVIIEVLCSTRKIDVEKFGIYTKETAELYVTNYQWYPMTPTLHKLLVHGPVIVESSLLPIGQLSEEAAEARNKSLRKYRKGYSRKCSRIATNEDVLNRLLLTSDPLLSLEYINTRLHRRPSKKLSEESTNMLIIEEESASSSESDE